MLIHIMAAPVAENFRSGNLESLIDTTQKNLRIRSPHDSSNQKSVQEFSFKTIATYAAEGMVLDKLSATKRFSNCVWLNIEEVDSRTVSITNCLRQQNNIESMPMLFPN